MPSDWTTYSGATHFANDVNFEVQRTNHFEIVIDLAAIGLSDDYDDTIRLCCTSANIPNITIQAQPLRHGNETVNVAGSPSWGPSSISVYDVIGKDMARLLQEWFFRIFNPATHVMGLVVDYKTSATIYQYSPDASVVRAWRLYGVFPTSLNFGSGSADGSGSPVTISMDLSVDKSIVERVQG